MLELEKSVGGDVDIPCSNWIGVWHIPPEPLARGVCTGLVIVVVEELLPWWWNEKGALQMR